VREFLNDVENVRVCVQLEVDRGARRETKKAIRLLNQALALNFVCVLRHMRHFVTADRFGARVVAQEFLEHTVRESEHSDLIAARIKELGGEITLERTTMTSRGHITCESSSEFEDIIRVDLDAERIAIETYGVMSNWLADVDPTSSRILQRILSLEEEHLEIMLNFVAVVID
jgi:bacterioferritin